MGLSPRNLWNMKRFYERYYQADTKLQQLVAVLPWGHNLVLINHLTTIPMKKENKIVPKEASVNRKYRITEAN